MNLLPVPIVKGHRILVEVTESKNIPKLERIVLPDEVTRRGMDGCEIGTVVSIGPDAFVHRGASEPYCLPNDAILFVQYAGQKYIHPDTKKLYRIINEEDVLAVIGISENTVRRDSNGNETACLNLNTIESENHE